MKGLALSNAQLLILDNLIYTDYCDNQVSVREIITKMEADILNGKNMNLCEMSNEEWLALIDSVKKDPILLKYVVQEYKEDPTGMRVACFVDDTSNPQNVNVVFRGTSGDYEWHDNGEGGYLSDTRQQEMAADYVNGLPEKFGSEMTVTGHSKGGNKAQYVTIVTDRIERCVSFDGQGFSQEFLEKYAEPIDKKSERILSISASDDFVNCLLFSIAGTKIYIETESQEQFIYYHKPNILLDENGEIRAQTEQAFLSKAINEYTTYLITNISEPERSVTIDGLIALLEDGDSKESLWQTIYAAGNALSHLDDFVFNYIGEKYGLPAELVATYLATLICPFLFKDDLLRAGAETLGVIVANCMSFADEVAQRLRGFGEKASDFAEIFIAAISDFLGNIKNRAYGSVSGREYAVANPYIKVDTALLRSYATRISNVNSRLAALDSSLNSLYWQVGFLDLLDILMANLLTGESSALRKVASYLNDSANDFESADNLARGYLEGKT